MEYESSDEKTIRLPYPVIARIVAITLMILICPLMGAAQESLYIPPIGNDQDLFPDTFVQLDPNEVDLGDCSNLTWNVTNAERVIIDPGIGSVGLAGFISVCPEDNTKYMLTAFNGIYSTHDYDILEVHKPRDVIDVIDDGTRISAINRSDFSISNVADGDRVPQIMTIIGECPSDLEEDIWLFVVSPNGLYYPQSADACNISWHTPKVETRWEARVGFGQPEGVGEYFGLVLTVADQNASRSINEALKSWCDDGVYTGWKRLPPGVTEIQRITVVRRTDTWAPPPKISNADLRGEASFYNISEDETVPFQMNIDGNCSIDRGGDIWVLVYPTNARWYPQSINACGGVHTLVVGEAWQTTGTFGSEDGNIDEPFDLVVVMADDAASRLLDGMQKAWCEADDYPGLLTIELPQGIEEKDRVRVYRR